MIENFNEIEGAMAKRIPSHPGKILEELYIKPLNINLEELAANLDISRNSLFKIRTGKASITPTIAVRLAEAFGTTPNLWLNLQQTYICGLSNMKKPINLSSQCIGTTGKLEDVQEAVQRFLYNC